MHMTLPSEQDTCPGVLHPPRRAHTPSPAAAIKGTASASAHRRVNPEDLDVDNPVGRGGGGAREEEGGREGKQQGVLVGEARDS